MGASGLIFPGSAATLPRSLFGYEVLDYLGRGAGSRIYVVAQPGSGQLYALKHVVPATEKDERFVEQLENEYEVGRQVTHACLRKCADLKVKRTLLRKPVEAALVMELVDGTPWTPRYRPFCRNCSTASSRPAKPCWRCTASATSTATSSPTTSSCPLAGK